MFCLCWLRRVEIVSIVYKHWPDSHGFITRTMELWNRWIRLSQQSVEHVSIVYTCNTYFVMHWSMQFIREYLVNGVLQCFNCSERQPGTVGRAADLYNLLSQLWVWAQSKASIVSLSKKRLPLLHCTACLKEPIGAYFFSQIQIVSFTIELNWNSINLLSCYVWFFLQYDQMT